MQVNEIQEIDFTKVIAIVTILSSAISVIINKLFENRQNTLKHKRLIQEKIFETKLNACKSAMKYYGTYFNYLYTAKSTLESLENYDYSLLLSKSNTSYENSLEKIQSEGEFHEILLFYDFYGIEDEQIAEKIKEKQKEYYQFVAAKSPLVDLMKEKELRGELIKVMAEAIDYFKNKIKMVRDDLKKITE